MLAARNLAEAGELPLPPETAPGNGGASGAGGPAGRGGGGGGSPLPPLLPPGPAAGGGGAGEAGGGGGGGGTRPPLPALPPGVDRGVAAVHGLVLRVACCPLPGLRVRLQLPELAAAAASRADDDR